MRSNLSPIGNPPVPPEEVARQDFTSRGGEEAFGETARETRMPSMNHPNRRKVLECGGKRSATPLSDDMAVADRSRISVGQRHVQSGVTAAAVQDASDEEGFLARMRDHFWRSKPSMRPLAVAVLFALAVMNLCAQELPFAGTMIGFHSVQYFEPPHQQQMKSRISGAEAQPLTDNLWLIKQVKIEKFDENGKLLLVAESPECVYDHATAVASSPGELHITSGDGQVRTDGEGFLWRQDDSLLTISNQVQTVIEKGPAIHP